MNTIDTRTLILIISPLIVISLVLVLAAVISIARKALPWSQKWIWLPILLINLIGPIAYFAIGSNMLDEKAADYQENRERNQ